MNGAKKVRPKLSLKEHRDLDCYLDVAHRWLSKLHEHTNDEQALQDIKQIIHLRKKLEQIRLAGNR